MDDVRCEHVFESSSPKQDHPLWHVSTFPKPKNMFRKSERFSERYSQILCERRPTTTSTTTVRPRAKPMSVTDIQISKSNYLFIFPSSDAPK